MTSAVDIKASLKRAICAPLDVSSVPAGYAISTGFHLPDGDLLSFYLIPDDDGLYHLEDDGMTLPNAIAAGLDLKSPIRESLLRGILSDEGLRYDDDLSIRSDSIDISAIGKAATRFVAALIRTQDLALLSRENVAASFADDVRADLAARLPETLAIDESPIRSDAGSPDIILRHRSTGLLAARVFAASGDLRLMDAIVEYQDSRDGDSPVIAVVDRRKNRVSERRFNTATNKGLQMAVVDGPDHGWIERVIAVADRSPHQIAMH